MDTGLVHLRIIPRDNTLPARAIAPIRKSAPPKKLPIFATSHEDAIARIEISLPNSNDHAVLQPKYHTSKTSSLRTGSAGGLSNRSNPSGSGRSGDNSDASDHDSTTSDKVELTTTSPVVSAASVDILGRGSQTRTAARRASLAASSPPHVQDAIDLPVKLVGKRAGIVDDTALNPSSTSSGVSPLQPVVKEAQHTNGERELKHVVKPIADVTSFVSARSDPPDFAPSNKARIEPVCTAPTSREKISLSAPTTQRSSRRHGSPLQSETAQVLLEDVTTPTQTCGARDLPHRQHSTPASTLGKPDAPSAYARDPLMPGISEKNGNVPMFVFPPHTRRS